jgi:hypothetical protein
MAADMGVADMVSDMVPVFGGRGAALLSDMAADMGVADMGSDMVPGAQQDGTMSLPMLGSRPAAKIPGPCLGTVSLHVPVCRQGHWHGSYRGSARPKYGGPRTAPDRGPQAPIFWSLSLALPVFGAAPAVGGHVGQKGRAAAPENWHHVADHVGHPHVGGHVGHIYFQGPVAFFGVAFLAFLAWPNQGCQKSIWPFFVAESLAESPA